MPNEKFIPFVIVSGALIFLLFSWMFFIWFYRGYLVKNTFNSLTRDWMPTFRRAKLAQENIGNFLLERSYSGCTVNLFSYYDLIGTRYVWYLAVNFKALKSESPFGIYGSGYAVDLIIRSKDDFKPFKRGQLHFDREPVDGWEFCEAALNEVVFFYRLPDFLGYGDMKKIIKFCETL